jgi:hypothetical protein
MNICHVFVYSHCKFTKAQNPFVCPKVGKEKVTGSKFDAIRSTSPLEKG